MLVLHMALLTTALSGTRLCNHVPLPNQMRRTQGLVKEGLGTPRQGATPQLALTERRASYHSGYRGTAARRGAAAKGICF